GIAIGRVGCFLNGCCFGLPTKLPWGMVFPFGSLAHSYFPGEHLHPTQLYSSLGGLVIFLLIVWLYRQKKYDGHIFLWWLIFYSIYRFLVEFLRYSPMHWLGLTPSQWIVVFVGGSALLAILKRAKILK
ncbi:prolipoprotein diacylglyceryl transferase, partial [Candidatus Margulisiibacteriota bacterium]